MSHPEASRPGSVTCAAVVPASCVPASCEPGTLGAQLLAMPKVELHVHLEGCISAERIVALAADAGEPLPAAPERIFEVRTLSALLERLDWWCSLVRSPEAAALLAADAAARFSADGVVYAEVIVNPTHWRGIGRRALLDAVSAGFSEAAAAGGCDCRILVSLLRRQSAAEAADLVADLERHRPPRLVGLSVDGDEAAAGSTGRRFAPAYFAAGNLGLGLTAHAGESSGPEGVRSALDDLGVTRVDHGVRAAEDPTLLSRLAADGVTLDVCLSSNLVLLYPDLDSHPIRRIVDAGVAVTVNTDDPAVLGTTLSTEMALAAGHCGWGLAGALKATSAAIEASFADGATAASLHDRLRAYADALGGTA